MNSLALAVDFGGTNIRVALLDRQANISHRHSVPTLAHLGRDAVLERLIGALEHAITSEDRSDIVGIGASLASPTDPETGTMHGPPNLPGWHGFSPKKALEDRFLLPVAAANDATLAALAEQRYGAGRGHRHVIYMTVSTGIGGGIVIDGKLYTGSRGFAGEIGHVTVDRGGPRCNCGNTGCLEVMASGTAVARMARERLAGGESSVLVERSEGDLDRVDARMVAQAAREGDRLAVAVMSEASANLGIGIVGILHTFDPDVIVIGGGMTENFDIMLPVIRQEVGRRVMSHFGGDERLVMSELGDDVSLVGAAALAFSTHGGEA